MFRLFSRRKTVKRSRAVDIGLKKPADRTLQDIIDLKMFGDDN